MAPGCHACPHLTTLSGDNAFSTNVPRTLMSISLPREVSLGLGLSTFNKLVPRSRLVACLNAGSVFTVINRRCQINDLVSFGCYQPIRLLHKRKLLRERVELRGAGTI